MEFKKQSDGFWRSDCGRFDIIHVRGEMRKFPDGMHVVGSYYRAIDWDRGEKSGELNSFTVAEKWCKSKIAVDRKLATS